MDTNTTPSLNRCSSFYTDDEDYTALQFAVRRGSIEQVKYLIDCGTELDIGPDPALHLALRKQNLFIVQILLQAGADFEIKDSHGDYPIHIACTLGLLEIVQTLCALGCSLEIPTLNGLYPLHLAARYGHIHVVRCLCAAGCNIDVRNYDNIRADITALKYGYNDIAELLDKLRITGQRDHFARQLVPTTKPALRLSLRLLGNCGVGKTALCKSLTAGLFSSLFRRSSSLQSNKSRPSSPINGHQIEMDVTSRQNSLTFETTANYQSTNGIYVQNLDISNVGDVTIWEFSGQENYFPIYHHFLWPSPYILTLILFNLDDPLSVQIQQVCFWVNFLIARQPADLLSFEYGRILLVGTHVDQTRAIKTQNGEWICTDAQILLETVRKLLPHITNLMNTVIIMDANVPASYAFKQLKTIMAELKQECIQDSFNYKKGHYDLITNENFKSTVGTWTGILESTLTWLTTIQKQYEQFPVLTNDLFSNLLRNHVNILASNSHIYELLKQLHLMGEIFCINNLIIISIQWLTQKLLAELLSIDFLLHCRATGCYTIDDFQAVYNQCDAGGVLDLLEAFDICCRCDIDGEIEYEFPIYNQIETINGLWDSNDPRYCCDNSNYCGVRFYTPPGTCYLFKSIYPYLQITLRRASLTHNYCNNNDDDCNDNDLYQWHYGSKLCNVDLESLITLEINNENNYEQFIEIKIRGPNTITTKDCFEFLQQLLEILLNGINCICPGLLIEQHYLSPYDLKQHALQPYCYQSDKIMAIMLESESTVDIVLNNPETDQQETLIQIILFGDVELTNNINWGCALKINDLSAPIKLKLCGLLDPPEPHGRDWCLLALRLGLCQDKIAALDSQHSSHTMRLLTTADCSIGALITSLHELDRADAADVILRSAPIYKIIEHVSV